MGKQEPFNWFRSTYARYRQDVEHIAGWLAQASRSRDYKLKQVSRAGKKTKNKGKTASNNSEKKYVIKREVPIWLQFIGSSATSNAPRHSTLTALEHAYNILRPCIDADLELATTVLRKSLPGPNTETVTKLDNEDEDIACELPKVPKVVFDEDEVEREEELLLAMHMYIQDFEAVRQEAYLAVAATFTNAAIGLAEFLEGEFDASVIRPAKYTRSLQDAGNRQPVVYSFFGFLLEHVKPKAPTVSSFWSVHEGLAFFFDESNETNPYRALPDPHPAKLKRLSPTSRRAFEFAQLNSVFATFTKNMPDMWKLAFSGVASVIGNSEQKYQAWAVLAVQLHLDSAEILGKVDCQRASTELNNSLSHVDEQLSLMFNREDMFVPSYSTQREALSSVRDTLLECKRWILRDGLNEQYQELKQNGYITHHGILE
ncbi:hypothetical protein BU23DRAFT_629956 [Bimuria novae-zelandiae CBS 107.79]|uniref:Uncharacterized protein n=1 Tax=Bimuria novae-zelandiae CBS 107.79 TaxID=1447943 RepID=A0A6A5VKN5_9PLEO|nr:hypothetical protein BU23DRAFT_629956 [Bimuria novae-zelandiae CBS 107.79]